MRNRRPMGMLAASSGALLVAGWLAVAPVAGAEGDGGEVALSGTISSHNTNGFADSCDETQWHWVIAGISPTPDGDDAPAYITVSWSDGSTSQVSLWKVSGSVAHYSTTAHLDDDVYPTGATATWPDGTEATSYNNFNLSSGPCEEETEETTTTLAPTTTVEETTTTLAPTTTVEETTTTVEATTTTEVGGGGPTTTVEATTTTAEEGGGPTTTAGECEDAWVWAIIGVWPGEQAAPFITVTWSDGSVTQVEMTGITGVVAFYTSTEHQADGIHPVSADYTWPDGSDNWFRMLILVQIPCEEDVVIPTTTMAPTTTVEETTTTMAPTTTVEETTTTMAPTTTVEETTTTLAPTTTVEETTTTVEATTTTEVGGGGPTTTMAPTTTVEDTTTTVEDTTTTVEATTTTAMATTTTAEEGGGPTTTVGEACHDAWVWAIIGVWPGEEAAAFITVTWSDGSVTQVEMTSTTGAVALYTSTEHQADGIHPVSADYTWPDGSDNWFRVLLLVQVPCEDDVVIPTTTIAPTTTMAPTTTIEETTTTMAPTTTIEATTTTEVAGGGPTTTVCTTDEWIWAIIGLWPGEEAATFITVTWSDGSVTQVQMTSNTGVIALYSTTEHKADGIHPVSADYTWPDGSDDWFRSLVLLQVPCGEPAELPTTTLDVGAGGPTTTVVGGVGGGIVSPGAGGIGDSGGGLPSTGGDPSLLVMLALGLFVTGSTIYLVNRGRTQS